MSAPELCIDHKCRLQDGDLHGIFANHRCGALPAIPDITGPLKCTTFNKAARSQATAAWQAQRRFRMP